MRHAPLNICVIDNLALKAGRDRVSGVLRYAAGLPQWHVRILTPNTKIPPAEFSGLTAHQAGFAAVIGDEQDAAGIFRGGWNPHRHIPHVVIDPYPQSVRRRKEHVVIEIDDAPLAEAAAELHARHGLRQLAYFGGDLRIIGESDQLHTEQRAHALRERAEALNLGFAI